MKNIIAFLIFCTLAVFAVSSAQPKKKYISSSITVHPESLPPGGSGEILITLTPVEGIHINTEPPIEFIPDKKNIITTQPVKKAAVLEPNGYFDPAHPIVVPFTVPKKNKQGKISIKGVLRYFICSDAEGWCNRFQDEISVPFTIR